MWYSKSINDATDDDSGGNDTDKSNSLFVLLHSYRFMQMIQLILCVFRIGEASFSTMSTKCAIKQQHFHFQCSDVVNTGFTEYLVRFDIQQSGQGLFKVTATYS